MPVVLGRVPRAADRTTITLYNSVGHSGARVTCQVRAAGLVGDVQRKRQVSVHSDYRYLPCGE